jgi:hypothetical protein
VVDDLRLGEHRAHAGDRRRIGRRGGQRPDLLGAEAQIARRLLEERAGAGRALVIEAERGHAAALVEPAGLHGLAAHVEQRPRAGEEMPRAARLRREVRGVEVAEGNLVAAGARAHHVRHRVARQAGVVQREVEALLARRFQPEPGGHHRGGHQRARAVQQRHLGVRRADVDARGDGHDAFASAAARARSLATSAAPSAPM